MNPEKKLPIDNRYALRAMTALAVATIIAKVLRLAGSGETAQGHGGWRELDLSDSSSTPKISTNSNQPEPISEEAPIVPIEYQAEIDVAEPTEAA